MAVPTTITDLSTTAASNSPAGSESIGTSLDDYIRSVQAIIKQAVSKGSDITAASTITPVATSSYFVVTGNTGITAIGETYSWVGRTVVLKFSGTPILTHSAGLILPGAANITTVAGDVLAFINESAGVWRCIFGNNGLLFTGGNLTGGINSARGNITQHATTMDFFAVASPDILDGTGSAVTITACVNAPQAGATRKFYPIVATVLTHGATFDIAGNANLTAAAGDCWIIEAKTASTYRVTAVKEDGTAVVAASSGAQIQPISASVAGNALTITAPSLNLDFRSATLTSGTVTQVTGDPADLVVSSGSTLGQTSAVAARLIVFALNNAGTIELAVGNAAGCSIYDETGLISTAAEGGAGAADSISTVYSTTSRSNVAYRIIGYLDNTQATAGTWATAPSTIQGAGGKALTGTTTKTYTSPAQTITAAGSLTLAHGLGVIPLSYEMHLKCGTGELGYTAGDIVPCSQINCLSSIGNRGLSLVPDVTNLNIRYGSDANSFILINKTTGSGATITNANWTAIFIARA